MSSTLADALSTLASTATDPSSTADSADASAGADDSVDCGSGGGASDLLGLRIASIFVILIGSSFGALFPVIARRSRLKNVIPKAAFDFAKYFGSGVIIATSFIHLLDPAIDALGSSCLTGTWQEYPWALAICMFSIFCLFFVELAAFRAGSQLLVKLGMSYDAHGHGNDSGAIHAAHGPEQEHHCQTSVPSPSGVLSSDSISSAEVEKEILRTRESHVHVHDHGHSHDDAARASRNSADADLEQTGGAHNHGPGQGDHHHHNQAVPDSAIAKVIGIFTLEFGVVLHSILIGLTLAVDSSFKTLFVVIIFHQTFEGLGLGSRLSFLDLPPKYSYIPYVAAALYGITTPIGIAAGLGVRSSYNPDSTTSNIVSGIMDSLSAGVLIYTGLVELLAHEFLFSGEMAPGKASNGKVAYACACMLTGAGLMALLGKWA